MSMPNTFDNLTISVKELVRKNPDNPITRSVLRKMGYMVPTNISGTDSVIDFLNTLIKVNKPYVPPTNNGGRNRETLPIDISATEKEYGTCSYSVRRSGSETVYVPIDIIRQSILEDDYEVIRDYIRDNLEISFDDYDRYEYSDYECSDSDDYDDDNDDNKAQDLWDLYIERYGDPNDEDEDEDEDE